MLALISSPAVFSLIMIIFVVGAIGSLFFHQSDRWANGWSSVFALLGTFLGIIFSLSTFMQGKELFFSFSQTSFTFL